MVHGLDGAKPTHAPWCARNPGADIPAAAPRYGQPGRRLHAGLRPDPDRRRDPALGFHTGPPLSETGSFARGHGEIDLEGNTVSGILCQEDRTRNKPTRAITMTVEHHLVYHSHYAVMWGFPGNVMKIIVRIRASNDPGCTVGTRGRATLFASYNGVRSDSVQFFFPATCKDHDHLYHGSQVNNQVPPL